MGDKLHVKILTAEKTLCDCEAGIVVAPGWEGEFGVLPEHISFLCALDIGVLEIKSAPNAEKADAVYAVHGGFLQVHDDDVLILATAAEAKEAIDIERARRAHARAEERLKDRGKEGLDIERAEAALKRAFVRLALAEGRWFETVKAEEKS